jgi:hypothetical protein
MQERNSQVEVAYVTAGELSAALPISDLEIARLARARHPAENPESREAALSPVSVGGMCCAYIRHLKSAAQRDRDGFWAAKAQAEKERVRKLVSENDTRAGRLLDAGEVEARERELAFAIRSRLALIPLRLADRLSENGDRLAIEAAAEAEINEVLISLSEIDQQVSELSGSDPAAC